MALQASPNGERKETQIKHTTEAELKTSMANAWVKAVSLECFAVRDARGNNNQTNHWALCFGLTRRIDYWSHDTAKICHSVRISVEHAENSLICEKLTMKPITNGDAASWNAAGSFVFCPRNTNITVESLLAEADPLLPFEYEIVSQTLMPTGPDRGTPAARSASRGSGAGRSTSRGQELLRHTSGCRDFIAQWFLRIYKHGYLPWESISSRYYIKDGNSFDFPQSDAFHHIIGCRYSHGRVDPSLIAKAKFPEEYERQLGDTVTLQWSLPNDPSDSLLLPHMELPYEPQAKREVVTYKGHRNP